MRSFSIERQRTSDRAVKTLGWHAGHRCPARSNPGGFHYFRCNARSKTPDFRGDGGSPPYPASQGNRASSTAMARVVVSWGATRTGAAAGAVVRRARRARWLGPEALPPRAPRRRSCEGVLLNSMCELSPILSSGHHIRSGEDTKQVRPSILRVGPSHTGNQPLGAHPRVLSPGRESQFESSTGRQIFPTSKFSL